MITGRVVTKKIIFEGEFEHGKATGPGELRFKKSKTNYKGNFNLGAFEDNQGRF